ncbi:MAG: DHH family phosphoesterase [Candidatus Aenigmatarchaeota archaeon]
MLDKAAAFISGCKGRTVVVYDTDGDGVGAAAILARTMKNIFGDYPVALPREHGLSLVTKGMVEKLYGKFDNVIFLDIAVDENPEHVIKISEKSRTMIVDHHQISEDLNGKGILHVNSSMMKINMSPTRYCVSKMVYDVCSLIADVSDSDWLAGIGIVNDRAWRVWNEFMESIYEKYGISADDFSLVNNIVNAPFMSSNEDSNDLGYKACLVSTPNDILDAKTPEAERLWEFHNTVEKQLASFIDNWKDKAQVFDDKKLIMLEIETEFSISSVISTKISLEKPDYTVMVARRNGEYVSVSLRRQDKGVDCGELAKKLTEGVENSSGGGHVPAAGMKMLAKDWNLIKERAQEIL